MSGKQGRRLLGATLRALGCLLLFGACLYVGAVLQLASIANEARSHGLIPPR